MYLTRNLKEQAQYSGLTDSEFSLTQRPTKEQIFAFLDQYEPHLRHHVSSYLKKHNINEDKTEDFFQSAWIFMFMYIERGNLFLNNEYKGWGYAVQRLYSAVELFLRKLEVHEIGAKELGLTSYIKAKKLQQLASEYSSTYELDISIPVAYVLERLNEMYGVELTYDQVNAISHAILEIKLKRGYEAREILLRHFNKDAYNTIRKIISGSRKITSRAETIIGLLEIEEFDVENEQLQRDSSVQSTYDMDDRMFGQKWFAQLKHNLSLSDANPNVKKAVLYYLENPDTTFEEVAQIHNLTLSQLNSFFRKQMFRLKDHADREDAFDDKRLNQ